MKIQVVAKTHNGKVREHNEDSFIVGLNPEKENWIFNTNICEIGPSGIAAAVADGMGGENAGEVASEIAIQAIKSYIQNEIIHGDDLDPTKILESSLIFAHNKIKEACKGNADYIGMGTTATVAFIQNQKLYLSWIGDSRVYRYSSKGRIHDLPFHFNNLEILNEDHSKVWQMAKFGQLTLEEARTHPESNIITQSLGDLFNTPQPDSRIYPLFEEDLILICSDGLNSMLSDEKIESLFKTKYESLEDLNDKLINAANESGGTDNITCVLINVLEGHKYDSGILNKRKDEKILQTKSIRSQNMVPSILIFFTLIFIITTVFFNREYLDNLISEPILIDTTATNKTDENSEEFLKLKIDSIESNYEPNIESKPIDSLTSTD